MFQFSYLCEENVVKEQLSGLLIFGDISVGVHTKDLRQWIQGKVSGVLDVALMLDAGTANKQRYWISIIGEI